MQIHLSENFTYNKLLRFVMPSVMMMVFTSLYGIVDGLFVSNFVGKTAFAAINFIMPFLMILGTIGFMIGTGGSATIAKTLGEGCKDKANRHFSMLIYTTIITGIVFTIIGIIFIEPIARLLGADGQMLGDCVEYGTIILCALTFFMLQNVFQSFLVTAEKPHLGLYVTVAAGVTNMILDYILIVPLKMGVAGAAVATATSQAVGGLVPLIYFAGKNNTSLLRLTKAAADFKTLAKVCTNGSSELMTNISMSLVNMIYNFQLMRFEGNDGIAAFGVIMYVNWIFVSIFIGYSIGSAPIVGYNYGAKNTGELKNIFKKSIVILFSAGIALTVISIAFARPLAGIFIGYDNALLNLTEHGLKLFSLAFTLCGFNIYGSAFFTALNNGFISAVISFMRTFVFQAAVVIILPIFFKTDGIWFSLIISEMLAFIVAAALVFIKNKDYNYL